MFLKIIFLHLFKKHDALQLSFSFFCFSALFCQKYWVIWSQKETFYRPSNRQYNSVICFSKWKCFWSVLFLNKSQQRGIPQKLLGKCNHLFNLHIIETNINKWATTCLSYENLGIGTNSLYCNILL